MSPFFSSHREHAQPLPTPHLPLTTRRQTGPYGALSFSLFLTRAIMCFTFLSSVSAVFYPVRFFSLPLFIRLFYLPGWFGLKTKNKTSGALDDKQTREIDGEREKKRKQKKKPKLTSAVYLLRIKKKEIAKNIQQFAFDQLYTMFLSRTGLYDKRE